jgi:hypothetical protein
MGIIPVFNVLIKIRLIILSNPNPYPVNMKRTPPDLSIHSLNSALRDMYYDNNYNNIIAKDLVENINNICTATSCLSPLPKYFNRLCLIFLLLFLCKLYKTIIMSIIKFICLSTIGILFFLHSLSLNELLFLLPSGVIQFYDDLINNIIEFIYDKLSKLHAIHDQSSHVSTTESFKEVIDVTLKNNVVESESLNQRINFIEDDLKEIKDSIDNHSKHYTTKDYLNIIATTLLINTVIVGTFFTMEYFIPDITHKLPLVNDTLDFYHNLWNNVSNWFFKPRDPGSGGSSGLNIVSNIISANSNSIVIPDIISESSSMSTVVPYYNYEYTDYFIIPDNNIETYNVMIDYFTIPENINNVDIPNQILFDFTY